ncbi:MAG: hypothetical protein L6R42_001653 [Xanthoria sp. 1 TBL-2021]|nr:MAG: hypothetical protein L6R42_001653 [Xanthoria sp. 1 TBL-2021]
MAQKGRFLCTNKEDKLISRGANPRTGLISPFVSDEMGDNSDGTDYVRVRHVRKDCEPTPTAQAQVPPISPDSLFEIPRKPVGGQRALSTPTPKGNRGPAQILSHLKRVSGSRKKSKGIPSPASLDIEDTAVRFHAYPSVSSKCRSTKYDQIYSPAVLQPFSNDKEYEPNHRHRKHYTLNDYVASMSSIDPLPRLRNPDLGKAYRRPKMLLPEHLRYASASPHDASILSADARMATAHANHYTSANTVPGQRPYIRRIPASTAVHRLDAVGGMVTSASLDRQSVRPLLQERDAPGHGGVAIDMRSSPRDAPTQPSDSTHAARKAFLKFQGHQPHQNAEENPQPHYAVKQLPPLLSLNGVLLPNQSVVAIDHRIGAENAMWRNTLQDAPMAVKMIGTDSDQTFVAHRSTRGTNEIWSSILAVALEIASLIDSGQVRTQLLNAVKHGALAAGRTPWAVRTLMSQDADVRAYLFAARCMMVTSLYLVILLSVFAAGFRTLELLVEIGHCIWYPFGVLLSVAGWILTP